jgi:hypothetical protein
MKLPLAIGGPIATAITAGIALTGELDLSHPLKQAIIIAGGLAIAIVGYLTTQASIPGLTMPAPTPAPPFAIPEPLPVPAPAPGPASAAATERAMIDSATAQAQQRSLP